MNPALTRSREPRFQVNRGEPEYLTVRAAST